MANERLYLRCCACGDMILLGKRYVSIGWFKCPANGDAEDGGELGTWLDKHEPAWRHEGVYDNRFVVGDEDRMRFEVVHESDEDFMAKWSQREALRKIGT